MKILDWIKKRLYEPKKTLKIDCENKADNGHKTGRIDGFNFPYEKHVKIPSKAVIEQTNHFRSIVNKYQKT